MKNKILKYLLIILVILLPLVNSHFFDLIGIKWGLYVDGNYEFTKSMFLNILSPIIFFIFILNNLKNKIIIPKYLFLISFVFILSSFFSDFTLTSIFGESGKGHGIILFLNMISLYIVFINQKKEDLKVILKAGLYGILLVIFLGFKEYYFPTFDYGNLSNRAISTFGHPNFLALYLLIFIPFLIEKTVAISSPDKGRIKEGFYKILLFLAVFLLILTKSIWGIGIFILYLSYILYSKNKEKINKIYFFIFIFLLLIGLIYIIYNFGLLTKLNSFISRFYIWETTLNIIFSNIKNIFIGVGADTLSYTFDNIKSKELYIFENIGFTADRPHNLLLNIFYHFGIIGLFLFLFLIYKLIKNYENNTYYHSIFIFLFFTFINFSSIHSYLIILLILTIINNENYKKINTKYTLIFLLILIIGMYGSFIYYISEYKTKLTATSYIQNKYYLKLKSENPEKKAFKNKNSIEESCIELTKKINSAENNFYCGDLFWNYNKKLAISYYKKGLELLPDMWNKDSKYYDNYFIKKLFVPERFYSKKFSNLEEILKRVGEK